MHIQLYTYLIKWAKSFNPNLNRRFAIWIKSLRSMCYCILEVARKLDAPDGEVVNYFGDRKCCLLFLFFFFFLFYFLFLFFLWRQAKVWDPGRGANHLGEGWRERNGFPKLYFHYHFVIIITWKGSFIVGWLGLFEKDIAYMGN
jgi:hypothetical protein